MLTDQGSVFISKEWKSNFSLAEISLINKGAESHNSLRLCEKYHSTVRTIYQKLGPDHPYFPCGIALSKFVQVMNEAVGTHGLVPRKLPDVTEYD